MKNTVKKIIATAIAAMTIATTALTASAFAANIPAINFNSIELSIEPTGECAWRFEDIETVLRYAPEDARFAVTFTEPLQQGYSLDFIFTLKDGRTKIYTAESSIAPMAFRTAQIPIDDMLTKLNIDAYQIEDMKITGASADKIVYVQVTDSGFIAD